MDMCMDHSQRDPRHQLQHAIQLSITVTNNEENHLRKDWFILAHNLRESSLEYSALLFVLCVKLHGVNM